MDSDLPELSPIERYEQRTAHFLEEVKRLEARSRGYSNLRLAIFLIGVVSALIVPKNTPFWILLLTALFLLLLVLFIAAAIRHQLIEGKLETSREMARRNEEGKARIARNWKDLPDRSPPAELVSSPLARDLDLFGRASLFDLLCTANTWEGRKAVAQALLSGIERENLKARHAAIRELASRLEFRQLLECATVPLRKSAVPGNVLFTPLQVDSKLLQQRLRRWFCLASPFAFVILLALTVAGFLPRWPIGLLLTLNYAVSFWWGRKIRKNLRSASSAGRALGHYLKAFAYLTAESLAELTSIKAVIETAQRATRAGDGLVFYLLDEILLGTNIDERRVITRRLIQNLLQQRAIGAMSTHDLSLLHFKEFAERCQKIHFQETFVSNNGQLEMAFDYRIQDGEAQSRNAIALMKHIGLDLKE